MLQQYLHWLKEWRAFKTQTLPISAARSMIGRKVNICRRVIRPDLFVGHQKQWTMIAVRQDSHDVCIRQVLKYLSDYYQIGVRKGVRDSIQSSELNALGAEPS